MMKLLIFLSSVITVALATVQGIDVSHFQGSINWSSVRSSGVRWAYIKATEGTTFRDPNFSANYVGATNAGVIRGAYHFAHPDSSSGAAQANFFVDHGGGWSADGITLPGALDIEYAPSGNICYGLSASAMVSWIRDFSNTYHARTGRFPAIYTTTDWWRSCTGNASGFQNDNPLWIARYSSEIGALPAGYTVASFWQYADSGPFPGDQDRWNGDLAGLQRMARGS
ncbi:CAZyme family GH25 [Agaricus bisporus var. burnettii]|uniref:Lysozyme n=1 Tax=Agaricus bisporus var. burnettii TaxID=192524 RepID=A0A8H7C5G4_AGABI|nr:CAZyme family GH25 [Agaricus bisporus var. burnettii]